MLKKHFIVLKEDTDFYQQYAFRISRIYFVLILYP